MEPAYILVVWLLSLACITIIFLHQPMFGSKAKGERKKRMENSPNYSKGQFHNLSVTPNFTNGANFFSALVDFLRPHPGRYPRLPIPAIQPDFKSIKPNDDILIWLGHSSLYFQLNGIKLLVDPVFSSKPGPIGAGMKTFKGTNIIDATALPDIDYLIITHDHWDHLDYDTVKKLKDKTKTIITGLGTGAHLEYWGFSSNKIIEADWNEPIIETKKIKISSWYARHFSGRGLNKNKNIWLSFIIQTPDIKIYLGGDSGYDQHYVKAGEKFGSFDLAILENGQYNKNWQYIHMMPEEVIDAGKDLNASHILPVHWGKFSLSFHPWDDPVKRVTTAANENNISLILPKIGEIVALDKLASFKNTEWWELAE